jgi:hypothetical protein
MAVAPKTSKKQVVIILSSIGAATLLLAGGLAWALMGVAKPDPRSGSTEKVAKFMASDKMSQMSDEEKMKYLDEYIDGRNSPEERKKAIEAMKTLNDEQLKKLADNMTCAMKSKFLSSAGEYEKIGSDKERSQFLTSMIGDMMKYDSWAREVNGDPALRNRLPRSDAAVMNHLLKNTKPAELAKLQTFMLAAYQQRLAIDRANARRQR